MRKIIYQSFMLLESKYLAWRSGLQYNEGMRLQGKACVKKPGIMQRLLLGYKGGKIVIGKHFKCNNLFTSNSIGLIQPCLFNVSDNAILEIGDNVGISGSTLAVRKHVKIGNNVLIGSGCMITDNDAHPIEWKARVENDYSTIKIKPIVIEDNCFIGARSIILKGVTIGECSVVGAGSVVVKDVPPHCIVCGNPAKVVKKIEE